MASGTATIPVLVGSATVLALSFALVTPRAERAGRPEGPAVQLRRGAAKELGAGKLLVAARNLPDPNFAATVVLLADFNAQGAMGLIVNRPTKVTLGRILPGLEQAPGRGATAFFGGPLSISGVLALLR